jgi:Zn-dependent peptidase ImmA (M78 family)
VKRGFKSECESIAAGVRAEMGLDLRAPLDARDLAVHLGIPVHPVSAIRGNAVAAAVRHIYANAGVLSAMTIFPEWPRRRRLIVFNDAHSDAWQNSDVAHELAHGLLLHEPRQAILNGCRDYSRPEEDEAAWLSGCLLVPREAALMVATAGTLMAVAAAQFGVSTQMMTYRVNVTGARRQAERARARRRARP